ncbi:hypothetical protein EDD86DRAFT_201845 [Gorgonomyces haynaldii]|nr:hypothetical protein EDD86DRAFT_201845 [Gorgonomyces haynaldii]
MAKRKSQKPHEPTAKEAEINTEVPRKYRELMKWMNAPRPKKEKQPERELDEAELRREVHASQFRSTNKYAKRVEWLKNKKKKTKEPAEKQYGGPEFRFGEVVQEPPKISIIPKKKGYIPEPKPKQEQKPAPPPVEKGPKDPATSRKRKLKDMPESERAALLKERERAIAYYRSKKQKNDN